MENVHKTRNLGALARTCDAVGIGTIHAIAPASGAVKLGHKTAGGTEKWIEVKRHLATKDAYKTLRDAGCTIFAAGVAAEAFSVTASCDASTQAIAPLDGVAPTPTPGVLGPAAGGGTAGAG